MQKDVTFGLENWQKELVRSIVFSYLQFGFDSVLNFNLLPFLGKAITLKDHTGWKPFRQFNLKLIDVLAFRMCSVFKRRNVLWSGADYRGSFTWKNLVTRSFSAFANTDVSNEFSLFFPFKC